jgi:hypothetical protein
VCIFSLALQNVPWLSGLSEAALRELSKGVIVRAFEQRDVLVSDTAVKITGGEYAGRRGEPVVEDDSIDLYAREGGKNGLKLAPTVDGVFELDKLYSIILISDPVMAISEEEGGAVESSERPMRDAGGNVVIVQVEGKHLQLDDRHAGEVMVVARGTVNVVVPQPEPRPDEERVEVRAILSMGSTFGEIGWLTRKKPTAKVRNARSTHSFLARTLSRAPSNTISCLSHSLHRWLAHSQRAVQRR